MMFPARGRRAARVPQLLSLVVALSAFGCSETEPPNSSSGDDDEEPGEESPGDDDSDDDAPPAKKPDASSRTPAADAGAKGDAGSKKDAATAPPAAQSDAGNKNEPGATSSLWCSALPVIKETCQSCHGKEPSAGAPMPLVTYEDFVKDSPIAKGKVYEVVKTRVHADTKPMPPSRVLTPEQLKAIDDWIADGAKPGDDPTCGGAVNEEPVAAPEAPWPPAGCEKIYKLVAGNNGQKAKIAARSETHPQFIVDAPWGDTEVQALGFRPITDNKKVLHHWIVYAQQGGAFLTGWAPGQDDSKQMPLPDDVGIYMPKGPRSMRLDMHYYNAEGAAEELDASGVEICTTTKFRKYSSSTFMGFTGIPFLLPGQETDIVGTCNVRVTQPVFLMSESPHAHKLAKHMKFQVKRGSELITLRDEKFNFEEQTSRALPEPFELKNGDQVITTCHFKNDTNALVTFGENTGSEMCFNFASYYPMGALSCGL